MAGGHYGHWNVLFNHNNTLGYVLYLHFFCISYISIIYKYICNIF